LLEVQKAAEEEAEEAFLQEEAVGEV